VLEKADGSKHDFIGIISICDISPDSEWTRHIVNQFQDACRELNFGGIHMDQYGSPKLACAADGSLLDLERCFAPLVDRTKGALSQRGRERFVVFNCVNAWPADYLSGSRQDATYIEIWNPFSRYRHLAEIARKARLLAPGRPVVLAAYLPSFLDPDESWERRESCLRLSLAVICANGATQLVLGEGRGVLAEGYYVHHGQWRDEFADILFSYMDFIVKHRELLFGAEVTDESLSYAGGVNEDLRVSGAPWSVEYEPGCVSVSAARVGNDSIVVNLVNLVGIDDDRWTTGKPEPQPIRELSLECLSWGDVDEVLGASPDSNFGRLVPLPWEALSGGGRIKISLPELSYWGIVLIRFRARAFEAD
jgi:dextranase